MPQSEAPKRGRARQAITPAPSSVRRRIINYTLVFITIVLVVDALVGDKGLLETMRARKESAEVAASLQALRQENDRMREQIRRLTDDPAMIESVARQDLGLIRPGELVFVVKNVDHKP